MKQIFLAIFLTSAVAFIASYFIKDKYPDSSTMLQQMFAEPVQTPTAAQPFVITKNGITFTITPRFDYDINGMVVTYHHSNDISDFSHKKWGDFLNIKDICVLWGSNLQNNFYKKVDFTSGNWTCFFHTNDQATWESFNKYAISNNHLLTDDPRFAKAIMNVRRGDQIHIQGYLADYQNSKGVIRRTSISRTDGGQGACEIIYVTGFEVLKKGNPFLNQVFTLSKYAAIGSVLLLIMVLLFEARAWGTSNYR